MSKKNFHLFTFLVTTLPIFLHGAEKTELEIVLEDEAVLESPEPLATLDSKWLKQGEETPSGTEECTDGFSDFEDEEFPSTTGRETPAIISKKAPSQHQHQHTPTLIQADFALFLHKINDKEDIESTTDIENPKSPIDPIQEKKHTVPSVSQPNGPIQSDSQPTPAEIKKDQPTYSKYRRKNIRPIYVKPLPPRKFFPLSSWVTFPVVFLLGWCFALLISKEDTHSRVALVPSKKQKKSSRRDK